MTTTKNLRLAQSLGADEVIDYKKEDFTKVNKKFDFVFDAVGKSSYFKCKKLMKENAVYFSSIFCFCSHHINVAQKILVLND